VGGFPQTFTDALGFYSIGNIPAGTWGFEFIPPGGTTLLPKLILGIAVSGNTTVNASLEAGKILSGFVRDTLGQPIFNIDLNVYDQATGDVLDTPGDNSDLTGFYDVVVPAGTYRLRWRSVGGERWVTVEMENVAITNDTTIDIAMESGFFVNGTVTGPGGSPVVNADLDAVDALTRQVIVTPGDNTNAFGQYSILVPPGTLDFRVQPQAADKLLPAEQTGVVIQKDTTINFTLQAGVTVSGFVRDDFLAAVPGTDIDVRNPVTGDKLLLSNDNTDALGAYAVLIPAGTFDIDYQPPVISGLAPVRLAGVTVTADTAINVTVPSGITLSGLVRGPGLFPVSGVDIDVKDAVSGVDIPVVGDQTDVAGQFTIVMPVGAMLVEIEPPDSTRLTPVRLALSPSVDTSIVVTLDTGMVVSGTVTDSTGTPVIDVDVSALQGADTIFAPGSATDVSGAYRITLAPGTYDLLYAPGPGSGASDTVALPSVTIARDTIIDVSLNDSVAAVPSLQVDSPSVSFTAQENGSLPASRSFRITNTAAGVLNWSLTYSSAWSSATPMSGSGNLQDISVTILSSALAPATYRDTIVVASDNAGNGPLQVVIIYTVKPVGGDSRGDVNNSGSINSTDIIYLVNFVFKGGQPPIPTADEGDVDCSGNITSSDIIFLVNYVFKGGPEPLCP
jgi:hypothetical protein